MVGQRNLPHVKIDMRDGMVNGLEIDGQRVRGVRSITFEVDAAGRTPTVTLELWATIDLEGDIATIVRQEQHVQRCTRPHSDENDVVPTETPKTAVNASSEHHEPVLMGPEPKDRVNHGYDGAPRPHLDQTVKDAVDWATR